MLFRSGNFGCLYLQQYNKAGRVDRRNRRINNRTRCSYKTTSRERTVDRNAGSISIGEIFDSPKEIYSTTQPDSHQGGNDWILQNKLQGIKHIAELLGSSYVDEYETYEEMVKGLKPEDLSRFYKNRLTSLSTFLHEEGNWGYAN